MLRSHTWIKLPSTQLRFPYSNVWLHRLVMSSQQMMSREHHKLCQSCFTAKSGADNISSLFSPGNFLCISTVYKFMQKTYYNAVCTSFLSTINSWSFVSNWHSWDKQPRRRDRRMAVLLFERLTHHTSARDPWHWPSLWWGPYDPLLLLWVTNTTIISLICLPLLLNPVFSPSYSLSLPPPPALSLALVPAEHPFMCLKCRAQKIKVCVREIGGGEKELCACVWMCRCKVLFERLSLDLMGKKKSWGGEIGGGGGGLAGL